MSTTTFKAALWIHAHSETGEPLTVELFSISGENVPLDLIRWLEYNRTDRYLLGCFRQLRPERCYSVLCKATEYSESEYGYSVNSFEIDVLSYVENRSAEEDEHAESVTELDLSWLQF